MKTKLTLSILVCATFLFSCNSSKNIAKVTDSSVIEIPLSGKEYQSDKDFFRAKQLGNSPDLSTAKKIALQNTKAEMAGLINDLIKNVTEQYTNQRTVSDKQTFENKFEENIRNIVNQELTDVTIIGEKVLKEEDGAYTYWLAIETAKATIQNDIAKQITEDEKLQLDFDKHQFMKIFDDEMEKFEKSQGN